MVTLAAQSLLPDIQNRLFQADDTVSTARARLVTEAWNMYADQPVPLKRALALDHVLRHTPLDLDTNPIIAGNTAETPRAWLVMIEHGTGFDPQASFEHDFLHEGWLRDRLPPELLKSWDGRQLGGDSGPGHLAIDYHAVVHRGLRSLINEALSAPDPGSDERRAYRKATIIAMEAVIRWANRYADAAEDKARGESDPLLVESHQRVASALRRVPEHPSGNLFEGLQAIALTHLALAMEGQGVSISIGLPDSVLAHFSEEAFANAEQAAEWCGSFLLAIAANSFNGRVSLTQAITLGGRDHRGNDRCNDITMAFLNGYERVPVADPHCFMRWHRDIDRTIWGKTVQLLSKGRSMPLLVNDHVATEGLIRQGISHEDAWNYCMIGCNEIGVPGKASHTGLCGPLYFNDLQLLNEALADSSGGIASADTALDAFEAYFTAKLEVGLKSRREWTSLRANGSPFPLTSALFDGCSRKGEDYMTGQKYARHWCMFTRGTTNAGNALAAIESMTRNGPLPAGYMEDAFLYSTRSVRLKASRWGNDSNQADHWVCQLGQRRSRVLDKAAERAGLDGILCCHVVRSLHHLDGSRIGPSLDGRHGGEPVADSIGAINGEATQGPTAMLNSVLKLDAARDYAGIYNLNLSLPGGVQSSPAVLHALIGAFFKDRGQELQINVLDVSKLIAAREDPDQFQDLVVRIAGLNARFVELSQLEQDEIIRRAEAAAR